MNNLKVRHLNTSIPDFVVATTGSLVNPAATILPPDFDFFAYSVKLIGTFTSVAISLGVNFTLADEAFWDSIATDTGIATYTASGAVLRFSSQQPIRRVRLNIVMNTGTTVTASSILTRRIQGGV